MTLNEENFFYFAVTHLNGHCIFEREFNQLLNHIIFIKRLCKKYSSGKSINVNLLINHFIILYNEFAENAMTQMLFLKINKEYYPILKAVLIGLGKIEKDDVIELDGESISISSIEMDENIFQQILEI